MRKPFLIELAKELKAVEPENIDIKEIFSLIKDILQFFKNNEIDEYEINQEMLEMNKLFRGYIVKIWTGTNFGSNKYRMLNVIVVRLYV